MKTIKSPEGVALLLESMWLRHMDGMKQRADNVFMVELSALTMRNLQMPVAESLKVVGRTMNRKISMGCLLRNCMRLVRSSESEVKVFFAEKVDR